MVLGFSHGPERVHGLSGTCEGSTMYLISLVIGSGFPTISVFHHPFPSGMNLKLPNSSFPLLLTFRVVIIVPSLVYCGLVTVITPYGPKKGRSSSTLHLYASRNRVTNPQAITIVLPAITCIGFSNNRGRRHVGVKITTIVTIIIKMK